MLVVLAPMRAWLMRLLQPLFDPDDIAVGVPTGRGKSGAQETRLDRLSAYRLRYRGTVRRPKKGWRAALDREEELLASSSPGAVSNRQTNEGVSEWEEGPRAVAEGATLRESLDEMREVEEQADRLVTDLAQTEQKIAQRPALPLAMATEQAQRDFARVESDLQNWNVRAENLEQKQITPPQPALKAEATAPARRPVPSAAPALKKQTFLGPAPVRPEATSTLAEVRTRRAIQNGLTARPLLPPTKAFKGEKKPPGPAAAHAALRPEMAAKLQAIRPAVDALQLQVALSEQQSKERAELRQRQRVERTLALTPPTSPFSETKA